MQEKTKFDIDMLTKKLDHMCLIRGWNHAVNIMTPVHHT